MELAVVTQDSTRLCHGQETAGNICTPYICHLNNYSGTRSLENPVMDEHLWRHFPEDLIERVLALLPTASFFRFRKVCKKWNSIMESSSFLKLCSQVSGPQTPCLSWQSRGVCMDQGGLSCLY